MMNQLSVGAILGTAIALGVVHVLTGPDHLSAVATLSANVPSPRQSFFLGVRWGIGHSFGLLLVGTIFIVITTADGSDTVEIPHGVEKFFESLVGVFMLLLGMYGIRRAYKKKQQATKGEEQAQQQGITTNDSPDGPIDADDDNRRQTDPLVTTDGDCHDNEDDIEANGPISVQVLVLGDIPNDDDALYEEQPVKDCSLESIGDDEEEEMGVVAVPSLDNVRENKDSRSYNDDVEDPPTSSQASVGDTTAAELTEYDGRDRNRHSCCCFSSCCCCTCLSDRVSTGCIALLMGIIHGLAGPGGVLGVIPAIQLHNWKLALLYLGAFCITSTFIMGVFATTYGTLSSKMGGSTARREFYIELFSASLSLIVGILWLILVPMDKLDDVFG